MEQWLRTLSRETLIKLLTALAKEIVNWNLNRIRKHSNDDL